MASPFFARRQGQSISRQSRSGKRSSRSRTPPRIDVMAGHRDVFINCPFDAEYRLFFWATVFVILRSGFQARCALETDDSSENRFEEICKIISDCRYGIHDICRRTELDPKSTLPRFNMPLELGLFLGAKRFGNHA